jgi:hypothetical protein
MDVVDRADHTKSETHQNSPRKGGFFYALTRITHGSRDASDAWLAHSIQLFASENSENLGG